MPGFSVLGMGLGPNAAVEPATSYRWRFVTLGPLNQIVLYAHKADRPGPEIDQIVLHHGQDEINLPGKNRWRPIEISFYEVIQGSRDQAASSIYRWWSQETINIQASKIAPNFRKNCQLAMLDGRGSIVWSYYLYNCWISNVTPSTLDYRNNEIAEITFKLMMDKAKEE